MGLVDEEYGTVLPGDLIYGEFVRPASAGRFLDKKLQKT